MRNLELSAHRAVRAGLHRTQNFHGTVFRLFLVSVIKTVKPNLPIFILQFILLRFIAHNEPLRLIRQGSVSNTAFVSIRTVIEAVLPIFSDTGTFPGCQELIKEAMLVVLAEPCDNFVIATHMFNRECLPRNRKRGSIQRAIHASRRVTGPIREISLVTIADRQMEIIAREQFKIAPGIRIHTGAIGREPGRCRIKRFRMQILAFELHVYARLPRLQLRIKRCFFTRSQTRLGQIVLVFGRNNRLTARRHPSWERSQFQIARYSAIPRFIVIVNRAIVCYGAVESDSSHPRLIVFNFAVGPRSLHHLVIGSVRFAFTGPRTRTDAILH